MKRSPSRQGDELHREKPEHTEAKYRAKLAVQERTLGADHPTTLTTAGNLAYALFLQDKLAEAEAAYRAVLSKSEKALGSEHPHTISLRSSYARVLLKMEHYFRAEEEYRKLSVIQTRILGDTHIDTMESRDGLIAALLGGMEDSEAEVELRSVIKDREMSVDANSAAAIADSRDRLGDVLFRMGRFSEAAAEYGAAIGLSESLPGREVETLSMRVDYANTLASQGKHKEANKELVRALEGQIEVLGEEHPDTIKTRLRLAYNLSALGRSEEALMAAESLYPVLLRVNGEKDGYTRFASRLINKLKGEQKASQP